MSDLNDLNKPTPEDTEPSVLDTLRAHIIRAATWSGWGGTANKVAGIMSAVTDVVSGGRSLRLYRRSDSNTSDEEIVSLPGVSIGGNAATASAAQAGSTLRAEIDSKISKTSDARPGVTRLYRADQDTNFYLAATWSSDKDLYWSLRGYYQDQMHSHVFVGYSGASDVLVSQGSYAATAPGTTRGPGGLSLRSVYFNGYPIPYGNLLHCYSGGANQFLLGWSDTDGNHAENFVRSKRDNDAGAWSPWAKLITDVNFQAQLDAASISGKVLAAISGAAAGAVGTYAYAQWEPPAQSGTCNFGDTVPGSHLNPCASGSVNTAVVFTGTWMCMGHAVWTLFAETTRKTLWMRIA